MMYDVGQMDVNLLFPCKYTEWEKWFAWHPVDVKVPVDLPELQHRHYLVATRKVWLKTVWRRKNLTFNEWQYALDDVFFQLTNMR